MGLGHLLDIGVLDRLLNLWMLHGKVAGDGVLQLIEALLSLEGVMGITIRRVDLTLPLAGVEELFLGRLIVLLLDLVLLGLLVLLLLGLLLVHFRQEHRHRVLLLGLGGWQLVKFLHGRAS